MEASGSSSRDEKAKICVLLNCIGPEGLEIFNTFQTSDGKNFVLDKCSLKETLDAFQNHCVPRLNEVYERFKFFKRYRKECEPVDVWVTDLKLLAQFCSFHQDERDKLIRDVIVFGVGDHQLQEQLIKKSDLDLKTVIDICRVAEISKVQMRAMSASHTADVLTVDFKRRGQQTPRPVDCTYCGTRHPKGRCPAFGKKCNKCGKMNHAERVCKSSIKR